MKIIKGYPKTLQGVIDSLIELPRELEFEKCMLIYEISKNLNEEAIN